MKLPEELSPLISELSGLAVMVKEQLVKSESRAIRQDVEQSLREQSTSEKEKILLVHDYSKAINLATDSYVKLKDAGLAEEAERARRSITMLLNLIDLKII